MGRKLLVFLTTSILVLSMGITAFAAGLQDSPAAPTEVQLKGETGAPNDDIINLSAKMDDLTDTGKTLDLPKQRTGQVIQDLQGVSSGTLTAANTWDYHAFSPDTALTFVGNCVTTNPNYTVTLGVVDYSTGQIHLTTAVASPNNPFFISLQPGNYAWVVQSKNGTYGDGYQLYYNKTLGYDSDFFYAPYSDLREVYATTNQKFTINGQVQNLDYRYDAEFERPPVGGGPMTWHKIHIWMINPNVSYTGVKANYYASQKHISYPNSIVFNVLPGGTFTHKFTQNPPYYNWYDNDSAGIQTPRAITAADVSQRGPHYLVYDLDTKRVVEFASGLTQPWTNLGDKHDFHYDRFK